jgi:hypothetical protein
VNRSASSLCSPPQRSLAPRSPTHRWSRYAELDHRPRHRASLIPPGEDDLAALGTFPALAHFP